MSLLSLVAIFLFAVTPGADPAAHLVLLTEENPPFNSTNQATGNIEGTAVTNVLALMRKAKQPYSLQLWPWRRAIRRTEVAPNTCLFSTNRTPAREELFSWVGPITKSSGGWAFFKHPDSQIEINTVEDAARYRVAGTASSASVAEFKQKTGAPVLAAPTDKGAMQLLYFGRAELVLSGTKNGPIAASEISAKSPKIAFLWKSYDLYLACNKNTDAALIERLNLLNTQLMQALQPNMPIER